MTVPQISCKLLLGAHLAKLLNGSTGFHSKLTSSEIGFQNAILLSETTRTSDCIFGIHLHLEFLYHLLKDATRIKNGFALWHTS